MQRPVAVLAFMTSLSFVLSVDHYIFQVQNANLTIKLLKQLDYRSMEKNLTVSIHSKLSSWEKDLADDPMLFENPVTNFLLLKMLRFDIQDKIIPTSIGRMYRRTVRVPTSQDLRKSAVLINDMIHMYKMSALKGIVINMLLIKFHKY